MTRVLLGLLAILLSQSAAQSLSNDPPAYSVVLSLLEDYSPLESNLTSIKHILETLASQNHYESMSKLGEFWFLGFPISPDNPHRDPSLIASSIFQRDFDKAIYYFKKSKSKSAESSFFTSLIAQQSLLITAFDKYMPKSGISKATIQSLEDLSVSQQSNLGILSSIFHYDLCQSRPQFPNFLVQDQMPYVEMPYYYKPKCRFTCEEIAHLALIPATKALEYIHRNKRESVPVEMLGQNSMAIGDDAKNMLKLFGKRAHHDHETLLDLGVYYMKGHPMLGIDPDVSAGLEILENAARKGNINAHKNLGVLYSKGIGVEKNMTKALSHFKFAMDNGSVTSRALLGEMYLYGIGVEQNEHLGLMYLNAAAQKGDAESMTILGKHHFLKKEWIEALQYLTIAAANDVAESTYYLGVMYLQGLGISKNCEMALELFKRVSFKGQPGSYAERAYFSYLLGDYEGAFMNYMVSASIGVENSLLSLAYMYQHDLVPEPYKCKFTKEYCSAVYYSLAYRSQIAAQSLGKILYKISSETDQDYHESYFYFKKSASLAESLFELAKFSEYGLISDKNITQAIKLYEEIISMAESKKIDANSKYPAMLIIMKIRFMNNPYVIKIFDILNSIFEELELFWNKISNKISGIIDWALEDKVAEVPKEL